MLHTQKNSRYIFFNNCTHTKKCRHIFVFKLLFESGHKKLKSAYEKLKSAYKKLKSAHKKLKGAYKKLKSTYKNHLVSATAPQNDLQSIFYPMRASFLEYDQTKKRISDAAVQRCSKEKVF